MLTSQIDQQAELQAGGRPEHSHFWNNDFWQTATPAADHLYMPSGGGFGGGGGGGGGGGRGGGIVAESTVTTPSELGPWSASSSNRSPPSPDGAAASNLPQLNQMVWNQSSGDGTGSYVLGEAAGARSSASPQRLSKQQEPTDSGSQASPGATVAQSSPEESGGASGGISMSSLRPSSPQQQPAQLDNSSGLSGASPGILFDSGSGVARITASSCGTLMPTFMAYPGMFPFTLVSEDGSTSDTCPEMCTRVPLGEKGRKELKSAIRTVLRERPELRDRVNAVAKLRCATIPQLLRIAGICGLWYRALSISKRFIEARNVKHQGRSNLKQRALSGGGKGGSGGSAAASSSATPPLGNSSPMVLSPKSPSRTTSVKHPDGRSDPSQLKNDEEGHVRANDDRQSGVSAPNVARPEAAVGGGTATPTAATADVVVGEISIYIPTAGIQQQQQQQPRTSAADSHHALKIQAGDNASAWDVGQSPSATTTSSTCSVGGGSSPQNIRSPMMGGVSERELPNELIGLPPPSAAGGGAQRDYGGGYSPWPAAATTTNLQHPNHVNPVEASSGVDNLDWLPPLGGEGGPDVGYGGAVEDTLFQSFAFEEGETTGMWPPPSNLY